ncbi:MAG: hypothetical protein CMI16_05630 [Opitutaceae bacterium]|nr:hypothetical protein [Opitutaceae bacterium]
MENSTLSSAEKKQLRGLGQRLDPALKLGKSRLTPTFLSELQLQLRAHELVKIRFLGIERAERTTLCEQIASEGRCHFINSVGHTALFYREHADPEQRALDRG